MIDLAKLHPLLEQAQVAIADLEVGRTVPDSLFVPVTVTMLIHEMGIAWGILKARIAGFGTCPRESDALISRLELPRSKAYGTGHEQHN